VADGDRLDDPLLRGLDRNFPRRPVRDGKPEVPGLLARERDDRRQLLRGKLGRDAAPIVVGEDRENRLGQFLLGRRCARRRFEPTGRGSQPVPPPRDALRVDPELSGLVEVPHPVSRPERDLHPLGEPMLKLPLTVEGLENCANTRGQRERWCVTGHAPSLIPTTGNCNRYLRPGVLAGRSPHP